MALPPLRALRLLPTLGTGGTERQCLEVADFAHSTRLTTPSGRELHIELATMYGPPQLHTLHPPPGIRTHHFNLPRGLAGVARSAGRLRKLAREYDCVHAMLWPAVWAAALARLSVPWVASVHGSQIRTDPVKLKLVTDRWAFGRADLVVFNSAAGFNALRDVLRIAPDHASVIENGKSAFAAEAGKRDGLVCIARYLPPKRHDLLLDALAEFKPVERPQARLFGLGTAAPELRDEISRRGLADHVQALGETDSPVQQIAAAELLVLPSDHEGSPNAILEAWAAGTPVLASEVSGIRELVRHGEDGWLVENRAASWSAAIARLMADASLRQQLAANGRVRLEREFSLAACAQAWATLYESVCAAG